MKTAEMKVEVMTARLEYLLKAITEERDLLAKFRDTPPLEGTDPAYVQGRHDAYSVAASGPARLEVLCRGILKDIH